MALKEGKGSSLFANRDFKKDELILLISGPIIEKGTIFSIPIDFSLFVDPVPLNSLAQYLCHDCEPSAGIKERTLLVAYRDIKHHEEVAIDYAMIVYEYGDEMSPENMICHCGKKSCRHHLGAWKDLPEHLKVEYYNYTSAYLQKMFSVVVK